MIRSRRRPVEGRCLEDLSDRELLEIRYFSNLVADDGTILFRANRQQQDHAFEILKQREKDR